MFRVTSHGTERGFSLLEVLVAFAVSALFLGVMLPATLSSLDRLADIKLRSGALSVARSTLEKHLAIARFEEGVFGGRQGRFTWRATISRFRADSASTSAFALRQVRVEVSAGAAEPLITLAAFRLGAIR